MEDKVIERLDTLGYAYDKDKDGMLIGILIASVGEHIKNRINDTEIPDGLDNVYVDMVCGEFLQQKKAAGQLNDIEQSKAVESIKMGDVTVSLKEGSTPEQYFDILINRLLSHDEDFIRYRKMVW